MEPYIASVANNIVEGISLSLFIGGAASGVLLGAYAVVCYAVDPRGRKELERQEYINETDRMLNEASRTRSLSDDVRLWLY